MNEEISKHLIAQIEALLFVAGSEGINLAELTRLLDEKRPRVAHHLAIYEEMLRDRKEGGLILIQTAGRYKLATKKDLKDVVTCYARAPFNQTLTKAALETLAIIAYRQPITRVEIEDIRGVQVASNLQRLRLHDLIETSGHLDQPGHPLLYRTTSYFLDYFGLNDLDELPPLHDYEANKQLDLFFGSDGTEKEQDSQNTEEDNE